MQSDTTHFLYCENDEQICKILEPSNFTDGNIYVVSGSTGLAGGHVNAGLK